MATLCTACLATAAVAGGLFANAAPSKSGAVTKVENVDDYIVVHSSTTVPQVLSASLINPAPTVTQPATTVATTVAPPDTPAPTEAATTAPARHTAPVTAAAPEQSASSSTTTHRTRPSWQSPGTTDPSTYHEHESEDSHPHSTEPGDD